MALAEFLADLDRLAADAESAFAAAGDDTSLEAARIEFLGAKNGHLKLAQRGLGQVDGPDKPTAGKQFNATKQRIEAAFEEASQRLGEQGDDGPGLDVTLPGKLPRLGHLHPITQTIRDMQEIMGRLGFSSVQGPEVEDDWHNFEALNIPLEHPARTPLDNFYLSTADGASESSMLLRSQTSTVQIRTMEQCQPPVRIISLGRVYRPDTADATHYPMFHQIEGLCVEPGITLAHLKSVLRMFCQAYFGEDEVHIRFRPSFFPFTEPSVEVDMTWQEGWMEMGGAGMVDPNVLQAVGYDPEEVTGFAFGLGVERVCMRRHGIHDIRDLYKNDVRFLSQF